MSKYMDLARVFANGYYFGGSSPSKNSLKREVLIQVSPNT